MTALILQMTKPRLRKLEHAGDERTGLLSPTPMLPQGPSCLFSARRKDLSPQYSGSKGDRTPCVTLVLRERAGLASVQQTLPTLSHPSQVLLQEACLLPGLSLDAHGLHLPS